VTFPVSRVHRSAIKCSVNKDTCALQQSANVVSFKRLKGGDIALNGKPISESYGASPAVWDHTVLPAT